MQNEAKQNEALDVFSSLGKIGSCLLVL